MYNSSSLVDAGSYKFFFANEKNRNNPLIIKNEGMWILKKWRKSSSLQQLSMTDTKEIEDSFLYRLSRAPVIYSKFM